MVLNDIQIFSSVQTLYCFTHGGLAIIAFHSHSPKCLDHVGYTDNIPKPINTHLRDFSAIKMSEIFFIFHSVFHIILPFSSAFNVLLIGDSVDQSMVSSMSECNDSRGRHWNLQVNGHAMPVCFLNFSASSIAALKIYGSKPRGPYAKWTEVFHKNSNDGFYHTVDRIHKGIQCYLKEVGTPDRILYNTVLWDARPFYFSEHMNETNVKWNNTLITFRSNFNDRLTDIENIMRYHGVQVELALRTAPRYDVVGGPEDFPVGDLLSAYNDIVGSIARLRNLSIYDFDKDLWSLVNYNRTMHWTLFRDDCHPQDKFVRAAALKLLCRRFSPFYTVRGNFTHRECVSSSSSFNIQLQQISKWLGWLPELAGESNHFLSSLQPMI